LIDLFIFSYIVSAIIFFVNGRYRVAITPIFIVFAAYAVYELIEIVKEKDYVKLKTPAYFLAVFLFIVYFTIPKPKFDNYDAYRHLGDVAYENKEFDKAIYNYNKSVVIRDHFLTFVNIGNAFAQKKDYKNAIMAFEKALLKNPDYELAHFNLGIVYTQMGDFTKAIESYNKTLEINPEFAGAYRNLGIIYYVSENYERALRNYTKFLEISDDEETKKLVRKDIETIQRKMK
jgi:tetratricopeptide (TPR) repeat protein